MCSAGISIESRSCGRRKRSEAGRVRTPPPLPPVGRELSVDAVYLRLKDERQFVVLARVTKSGFEFQPGGYGGVLLLAVVVKAVLAASLGVLPGSIGVAHETLDLFGVLRPHRDTDAGHDPDHS